MNASKWFRTGTQCIRSPCTYNHVGTGEGGIDAEGRRGGERSRARGARPKIRRDRDARNERGTNADCVCVCERTKSARKAARGGRAPRPRTSRWESRRDARRRLTFPNVHAKGGNTSASCNAGVATILSTMSFTLPGCPRRGGEGSDEIWVRARRGSRAGEAGSRHPEGGTSRIQGANHGTYRLDPLLWRWDLHGYPSFEVCAPRRRSRSSLDETLSNCFSS